MTEDINYYQEFFATWHAILQTVAIAVAILGPLGYLVYRLLLLSKTTPKAKYDFMGKYEKSTLKVLNVMAAIVLFSLVNLINKGSLGQTMVHFSVLLAFGIVVGTAHTYFSFLFINVYYPRILLAKMKKLRYLPRINPKTGNVMKLLSEDEEDKYLDEGMQAEEDIFSVDYDVWIDEKTGQTIIEKYVGNLQAEECGNCGFQTLRLVKEEDMGKTKDEQGTEELQQVKQHLRCSYCNRTEEKIVTLKCLSEDELSVAASTAMQKEIRTIKIDIFTEEGSQGYEFQNLQQARNFLNEYQVHLNKRDTTKEKAA